MAYPELNRRCAVAAKVEANAGTAETISFATDAIRCIGASEPEVFYVSPNDRDDHNTGGLGVLPGAAPSGRCGRVRMQFAVIGAGSAYAYTNETTNTLPECHPVLRAMGMSLNVATSIATYAQNDDPGTTITLKLRISGKEYTLAGSVAESAILRVEASGMAVLDVVIVGVLTAVTEQSLGSVTYDQVVPPVWRGANSLLIGAYQPQGRRIELDHGLTAEPNISNNAEDGLLFWKIAGRRPVITITARVPALSAWDPYAAWHARTLTTVDVVVGSAATQRMKLNIDNASYTNVADGPDGNLRSYTVQMLCGVHASHELSYVFD